MILSWVLGYKDVEGNEHADKIAKLATKIEPESSFTSFAIAGIKANQTSRLEWL